jgi:hypothetical protein
MFKYPHTFLFFMSVDELTEASTISLPRPLSLDEAETLLRYLAEKLPGRINYHISRHRSVYDSEAPGGFTVTDGTIDVSVMIAMSEKSHTSDSLQIRTGDGEIGTLSVMQFQTIPGYEFEEHRPEVRALWARTKALVAEYFR